LGLSGGATGGKCEIGLVTIIFWLALLALFASAARAASLIQPDDVQLRADVELLADAGYLHAPLTSWPLPWRVIAAELEQADLRTMSPAEHAAWSRLAALLHLEQSSRSPRASIGASARAGDAAALRWYRTQPRADEALTVGATSGIGGAVSYNLKLHLVHHPDDGRDTIRPDGSYVSLRAANWLINAGWINRWWGPGWSGSMSLSTNARPTPGIALTRASAAPFKLPVLNWFGPWRLTLFVNRLENDRYIPHPWFLGARVAFKPVHNVTIGLSRTTQWGGAGQPEDWVHFRDMVVGHDYHSTSTTKGSGVPGSGEAGFDIRWHFDIGKRPFALYAYESGEDATDDVRILPRKFTGMLGLETAGSLGDAGNWRLFVEYADTTTAFLGLNNAKHVYNIAYDNYQYRSGYRYKGRVIPYTTDNDSRTINIGTILADSAGHTWTVLVRDGVINRDDTNSAPPGGNTVSRRKADMLDASLSWSTRFPRALGKLTFAAGVTRLKPANAGAVYDKRLTLSWRYGFQ
jgi:hypothetical protein